MVILRPSPVILSGAKDLALASEHIYYDWFHFLHHP